MLSVIMENLFYPPTLVALYQVFSKFSSRSFQELLKHADLSTDGQNTHKACSMLHSCFSKVTGLNLKGNDKNRHCTYPGLLSGDG